MIFLIFAYSAGAQLVLGTNPTLVTSPKSDPAGASDIVRIGAPDHIDCSSFSAYGRHIF